MAPGYSKLATFMTEKHHPIIRKYQHLAARDLLLLQAELCHLDYEYEAVVKQSSTFGDERKSYDQDWLLMHTASTRGFPPAQWEISLATRAKLREYYSAIAQYSEIASIRQPKDSERSILNEWIGSKSLGGGCGFIGRDLGGYEQPSVYEAVHHSDLAILSDSHGEGDLFTKFINGPLLAFYHYFRRYTRATLPIDPENPSVGNNSSGLHHYNPRHVETVTTILGTVFSSLAPLVSIIVLSFVLNPRTRLGLVCAFTVLFSFSLAIATKARRVEIFAATAAFASVQVVFIGSSNSTF
ncbi:hypothetical protein BKA65DRAFT_267058 [Rhexocercosporidium sp. MPI-PUGE-AT-0058]|nr:hypothetical protein BKA65DRAFT_267058 [Rhexocercosporidium sp. MPI-PUGE-AT-0058]